MKTYATLLALASFSTLCSANVPLNQLAVKAGKKYLGTACLNYDQFHQDEQYTSIWRNQSIFGQITPGNAQKWEYVEPERGVFNFSLGNQIVSRAKEHGQLLRCHNLVWYSQLPYWLTSQTWDNATLISIMENHIKNEVQHWENACYAWDVVNEAISDNSNGSLRSNIWLDTIGPAYLPLAFSFAEKYASKTTKLYYNDYSIESAGVKSSAAQQLVKEIKSRGIRIDGVGLESHFINGEQPSYDAQVANMKAFTALGVEVAVTELDCRMQLPETAQKDAVQSTCYSDTVRACRDVGNCVGITVWDFEDKYSWVPSTFAGYGGADLYRTNYTQKPAVFGIEAVLTGASA